MKPSEAMQVTRLLLAAYPAQRQRMSDDDIAGMHAAYAAGLGDLDVTAVRQAIDRVVKSARFIPTIAEIRDGVVTVGQGNRKSGAEAWGEACAMIRRYGSHRTPGVDFEVADPLVERAIHAFGWVALCSSDDATTRMADRARFIELYTELAKQARTETAVAPGAKQLEQPATRQLGYRAPLAIEPGITAGERTAAWAEVQRLAHATKPELRLV